MSLKNIQQVKGQKMFKKADIFVYAAVLLLILAMFWIFVFAREPVPLQGIEIVYTGYRIGKEPVIFTYDFLSDKWKITDERWKDKITVEKHEWEDEEGKTHTGYLVYIEYTEDDAPRYGTYNVVQIDKSGVVIMLDADCVGHKCLTDFPPITDGNDAIVCLPHSISIRGLGEGDGELIIYVNNIK